MHRSLTILSSLTALVSVLGATGCSSSSASSTGQDDGSAAPPPATCTPSTTVSFKTDVIPVLENGCTLGTVCHGQMNNAPEEDLFLGLNAGGTDPSTVYPMLVGVMSKEDPAMPMIAAGNPDNSFLWHKLQGDQNSAALAASCAMAPTLCSEDCTTATPCGASMPYLSETFAMAGEQAELCTIQNWITEGAPNN
jgi:hypothetical protein